MIKYLKSNSCFILFGLLVIIVGFIITNSIIDGVNRIITQNMIDNTYIIHK